MSAVCIVQARFNSQRLPGKVLQPIGEWPAIAHTIARARLAVEQVVVATSTDPSNDPIETYVKMLGVPVFRWDGPEHDVLGRFHACVHQYPADVVVRLTADCPFVQYELIKAYAITAGMSWAYAGNVDNPEACRGFDVEAFPVGLLVSAHRLATSAYDREHVTPWMIRQAGRPTTITRPVWPRFTLDTEQDVVWLRALAKQVDITPPKPTTAELMVAAYDTAPTTKDAQQKGWLAA